MPGMGSFEVQGYSVTVIPRRLITTRSLSLRSVTYSHGIVHRATLYFYQDGDAGADYGYAYNVGGLNFNGVDVYIYAEQSNFESTYHVLQTEKPVYFKYWYYDSTNTTKKLFWSQVTTDLEFVGEGHQDPDAAPISMPHILIRRDAIEVQRKGSENEG